MAKNANTTITTVKTDDLKFSNRRKRGSRYDQIIAAVAKLKPGKALKVPLKELDPRTAHNRLNAAFRRADVESPVAGYKLVKRTTEDNAYIAIFLQEVE